MASLAASLAWLPSPSLQAEIIADSITQFSGDPDQNAQTGWQYGYRAVSVSVGDVSYTNYNAATDFTPFTGGIYDGPWDGGAQQWNGSAWDLNTAGAAPWTWIAQSELHPNGFNSGGEHWAIRRWNASAKLTEITPLAITWHTHKMAAANAGVTGAVFVNGAPVDWVTVADLAGVTRTVYVNANPDDLIDLVLSPLGIGGDGYDYSDGSVNWMTIDTTIPPVAKQPNGTVFVPYPVVDSDNDGLPDVWENAYAGNDLTKLNAAGDFDSDGLSNMQEFEKGTDPTLADTDNDGLSDLAETNTGTYVNPDETGTDPLNPDTDGDGLKDGDEVNGLFFSNPLLTDTDSDTYGDGAEVAAGHDPNDANNNEIASLIANSRLEFAVAQGQNDWYYGYRDFTADGGGATYLPVDNFNQFPDTSISGNGWNLHTVDGTPWSMIGQIDTHPNTAGHVHWTIRRWIATELTQRTPVTLRWHTHKGNTGGGNGVTGGVYINGVRADSAVVAYNDGTGASRTFYANLNPNDIVDLILSPRGTDGADNDGSDGSVNWLYIDPYLPLNPVQPDGTPFIPANAGDTDADGLPDSWEKLYFANDLTILSGSGDYDHDGLSDPGEYERDSNPTKADTDGDGLSDLVETGTGEFVSASDTGSSPTKADTDGDGFSDFAEVNGTPATNPSRADSDGDGYSDPYEIANFSNPNDVSDTPFTYVVADSISQFSGTQGQDGWFNGYRNFTADGGGMNYDPATQFIEYDPSMWTGSAWDLDSSGNAPWTTQGAQTIHPNGTNSTPFGEHWAIRRWVAESTDISEATPVAIIWHVRKNNPYNGGVSGLLFINGELVDSKVIPGNDTTGMERHFYANLLPDDIVDLTLSPQGPNNDGNDWSDESVTWFRVDKRIPKEPRQPDGSLFIPAPAIGVDTDHDGMLDFWEYLFAEDLTILSATSDKDGDGLKDLEEFQRDTNPLVADTDGDSLSDLVETKTGTFVGPNDTGSNPRLADTDGDGYTDGIEVGLNHNPNDANESPIIADSSKDISGIQGEKNWLYGYRDLNADGGANDYDADNQFLPFDAALWDGGRWDMARDTSPWTEIAQTYTHPSGPNPLHWAIRRWTADISGRQPFAFRYHARKNNMACGNGVTASLYINGHEVDKAVIAFSDGIGVTRTFYAQIQPGDSVDLVLKSKGTDGDNADACDGTDMWMQVDEFIPANPTQPDGTPFEANPAKPELVSISLATAGQATLTWKSKAGVTYMVEASADLKTWQTVTTGLASGGAETTYADTLPTPQPANRFYRVAQE